MGTRSERGREMEQSKWVGKRGELRMEPAENNLLLCVYLVLAKKDGSC